MSAHRTYQNVSHSYMVVRWWLMLAPETVAPDERQRYTEIIDDILATADLETISRKKVRQGLESRLGGKDLSEHKVWTRREILFAAAQFCCRRDHPSAS